ncbi:MAG TPA: DUF2723 domain-containing protein, partial [Polyangia bacterium]|nr:DUF2723 domain-containing protein [Polyangia bacterium]
MGFRRALGWLLFAAAFAVFVLAAPPGLYWLDSGELTAAGASLGIAHPTGFPIFCLLGKALALVPLGEVAFRITVASALTAAGTVYALYRLGLLWLGEGGAATAGAALGALLPAAGLTLFRQATVVEVYAPTALVLVLALSLLTRRSSRAGLALALVCGLALGLHAQLRWLVVAPALAVLGLRLLRGQRALAAAPALLALGAGILLYLPVRSAAARRPSADWGHPATARALADQLSAGRIRRAFEDQMLSREPRVVLVHTCSFGGLVLGQLGVLAPIMGALGLFALARRRPAAAALLMWVGALDFVYAIWVNPMGIEDLQNGVPLHLALGLAAGAGAAWLGQALKRAGAAGASAIAVCVLVPAVLADGPQKWGSSDGPDRLLHAILAQAPPRGAVLAQSDDVNAGLWLARALGERPDLFALPTQHLWDRRLIEQVFARAGEAPPPDVIAGLLARGTVLAEDGPDPLPGVLSPAAPLLRLVAPGGDLRAPPAARLWAALARPCSDLGDDTMGRRACSALCVGLGKSLYLSGRPLEARAVLEAALELRPGNLAALTNLGVVRTALGEPAAGAALEERALAIDPDHYSARINAGRYRLQTGDLEAARRHFERAHALRPQAAPPLVGLAVVLARSGHPAEG